MRLTRFYTGIFINRIIVFQFFFFFQIDSNYQTPQQQIPVTPSMSTPTPTLLHRVVEELEERAEEINRQQKGNLSISVQYEDVSDNDIYDVPESATEGILEMDIDNMQSESKIDIDPKEEESVA